MKCDEVLVLQSAYLDSELDAKTSVELTEHLKACAECRRAFAEEERFEGALREALQSGEKTERLWHGFECRIRSEAADRATQALPRDRGAKQQPLGMQLRECLKPLWGRASWAWTGLAAAWAVIFLLNVMNRETGPVTAAHRASPSVSEVHFALVQKRVLMAELVVPFDPSVADAKKASSPGPRSDRVNGGSNA
jgi:anti-sigma factor RsiW